MRNTIIPWAPYAEGETVVSRGRRTLVSAFADLVAVQHSFARHELPEIFAAPQDEGENDAFRHMVMLDAAFLSRQFVLGKLATFARPLGGGEITTIPAEHWEVDDPLPRMATGAYNPEHWADPDAPLTHRIFVDGPAFDEWLAALKPLGAMTNREIEEALDPQLRAARAVAARRIGSVAVSDALAKSDDLPAPPASSPLADGSLDLLRRQEVEQLVKLGRSAIYSKMKDEGFPQPIKIGSASRWRKRDVLLWIEEQAARHSSRDN